MKSGKVDWIREINDEPWLRVVPYPKGRRRKKFRNGPEQPVYGYVTQGEHTFQLYRNTDDDTYPEGSKPIAAVLIADLMELGQ